MSIAIPDAPTGEVAKWITIEDKRFGAASFSTEVAIDIDTVWRALADGYVDVADIHTPITASYGLPGEPERGPGAVRHCDLVFKGKKVSINERIIDWIETPDHREYTYDVYESKGFPAKAYNTWSVSRSASDKTILRNVFYFRMKPAAMTGTMFGQMGGAAQQGVLAFKHYLETGEQKAEPKALKRLYPAA